MLGSWKKRRNPTRSAERGGVNERGPELAFAASAMVSVSAWGTLKSVVPGELLAPAVATLLFGFAAAASLTAWRQQNTDHETVTYWDVAGCLILSGLVVAAFIQPEQLARYFSS